MRPLEPKVENHDMQEPLKDIEDGTLRRDISTEGKYEYEKRVTISGVRYWVMFDHYENDEDGEASIHFGLVGVDAYPVTNAGLEVFGKIADVIGDMYDEVSKEQNIKKIKIYASIDTHSKDDVERINEIIGENPQKLNGIHLKDELGGVTLEINGGVAIIKMKSKFRLTVTKRIPVSGTLLSDIKHITNLDISFAFQDILNYIKDPSELLGNKKQNQRLKLYMYYLQKRYPQLTFNSNVVVNSLGKKEIQFEKDEDGEPYFVATIH